MTIDILDCSVDENDLRYLKRKKCENVLSRVETSRVLGSLSWKNVASRQASDRAFTLQCAHSVRTWDHTFPYERLCAFPDKGWYSASAHTLVFCAESHTRIPTRAVIRSGIRYKRIVSDYMEIPRVLTAKIIHYLIHLPFLHSLPISSHYPSDITSMAPRNHKLR